jgi:DNA repair protein RadA/Sms
MAKSKSLAYRCESCEAELSQWFGKCPKCDEWNTIAEKQSPSRTKPQKAKALREISESQGVFRETTHLKFLDEILGGGLPKSSTVLLAGEPGIGKSTLLFQMFGRTQERVLYVSAEESAHQVAGRFRSFAKKGDSDFFILTDHRLTYILEEIERLKPAFVAIDSIQMISTESLDRLKGGAASLREIADQLVSAAKSKGFSLWIVGHVTKDGDIAGPKTLEHLVDTVLMFSSCDEPGVRFLQTQKHRFGRSGELAVLEISEKGLTEKEGGDCFWVQQHGHSLSGCAQTIILFGSRFYCVEIQALCSPTHFPSPRRSTTGYDLNRLYLVLAVLEKKLKIALSQMDVYLNVVGGLKIQDPAADLAVAAAILSSFFDKPTFHQGVFCAEIGLTGELRKVPLCLERAKFSEKIGRKAFMTASGALPKTLKPGGLRCEERANLHDAMQSFLS